MHDAIVIGGGISGLTAAWALMSKGQDVVLFEAGEAAGGNIQSVRRGEFIFEKGPNSFLGSSEFIWQLIAELGISDRVVAANAAAEFRYIYRDGSLHALPMSFSSFFGTKLLSLTAKLRLMLEPFMPNRAKDSDTAWEFFVRRFGEEAATYIMGPFVSGIYAGDVKLLGAKAAFKKFWLFEKEKGSMIRGAFSYMRDKKKRLKKEGKEAKKGLYSFQLGLGEITQTLAEKLGDRVRLNCTAINVKKQADGFHVYTDQGEFHAKKLIIAVPPPACVALVKGLGVDGGVFDKIPMAPVAMIHWRHPTEGYDFPKGFGFLVPRNSGQKVLGTIFPSQLFPNRAPDDHMLFSSYVGGMCNPENAQLSDDALLNVMIKEHTEFFGFKPEKLWIEEIFRYHHAIPQLTVDHPKAIEKIASIENQFPGLVFAGNYLTGVGVEQAVESGYMAVEG